MPVDDVSVPQEGSGSGSQHAPTAAPDGTVTSDPILAPRRPESPAEARRSIIGWVTGMVGFVAAAAVIGGIVLKVPYVALVPGSARDTEPLLEIDGIQEYPSEGELLLLTVRFRTRPNLWEYLWLRMDDDAEVLPEEAVFGERTPEENREFNLELMNNSKQLAVAVALEQLGYDAVQSDAVVVRSIEPGQPADGVLVPGDSILSVDGAPTPSSAELVAVLTEVSPGTEVELQVEHFPDKTIESLSVVLGRHPERPESGFLGIVAADRLLFSEDFEFDVEIDSGSVGGPSAGLAFTLAVLDQLTEGELTGGKMVAVTGEITADGDVRPVGGVRQKAAAVRDLGADVFIIPAAISAEELAAVVETAAGSFDVIPVSSVEEALDALAAQGGNVESIEEFAAANQSEG